MFAYRYAYDGNGNQILKEENDKVTAYSYDALNRLKEVAYPGSIKERFIYDANGNRLKREYGDIFEQYEYDSCNRLIQRIKNGLLTEYEYDARGNLIKEKEGELTKLYSYDGFDRLIRVQNPDGTYMENIYDAENLRTVSIENGRYNRYVYNGRNIACEVDEDWSLKDRIVFGHTILQREDSDKNEYYYIHNAHGDITALTDGKGEVINSYSYDAFGNILDSVEKIENRFKYSGEMLDPVTGQYYLRARYYNPSIGRFMQEDTFRGDGLNLYTYVANNPIKYIDPTGHCKENAAIAYQVENILRRLRRNPIISLSKVSILLDYLIEGLSYNPVDHTATSGPTVMEAALIAKHVYSGEKGDELPGGWKMLEDPYMVGGLRMGVYGRKGEDGEMEYVIANAGTEPTSLIDWENNLKQPFGKSEDMKNSLAFVEEFMKNNPSINVTFVGHSKGGAEAAANAVLTNRNAILFNPATVNLESYLKPYGVNKSNYTAEMTAFIVEDEILNNIFGFISTPIDKVVYLPRQHSFFISIPLIDMVNSIRNHSMDATIKAIEEWEENRQ